MFLSNCCVSNVTNVLEPKEQTHKAHPRYHHHDIKENQKVRLVIFLQSHDLSIVCFISIGPIGLRQYILFEIKNSLNLGHHINISV